MRLRFHLGRLRMGARREENSDGETPRMLRAAIQAGDGICMESGRPFPRGMTHRAFELLYE